MKQIVFMLGKPVRPDTIFPVVFRRLEANGTNILAHVPSSQSDVTGHGSGADLIVQRGLSGEILSSIQQLEDDGIRCCNQIRPSIAVGNRTLTNQKLGDFDLPCPTTSLASSWEEVLEQATGAPCVIKAVDGATGRGRGVFVETHGQMPGTAPFPGPYVVQEHISNDGRVYKAYVAGRMIRGLIKPADESLREQSSVETFSPDSELTDLAIRAGAALGLEIYGVDFLYGQRGPVIIDVNAFPGFRGVPEAAEMVATHLRNIVWDQA